MLPDALVRHAEFTLTPSVSSILGSAFGPILGGGFHDLPEDPAWQFRLPSIVAMFMPALLCATVPLYMLSGVLSTPSESPPEPQERGGQRPRLFTLPIVLGLLCTLVSASVVGTLDSTLDLRLSAVPLVFSATQVSSTFTASSLFGSAVSLPLAFLVNHISGSYRLLSFVTAIGFLVVGLAFLLLAPLGSAVLRMPGSWTLAAPNSVEAVYVAMKSELD